MRSLFVPLTFALVILSSHTSLTQSAQLPSDVYHDSESGPTYGYIHVNYFYPGQFSSFDEIDFRNFTMHTFDDKQRHLTCGRLHGGLWSADEEGGHESLAFNRAYPLPSGDGGVQFMLVLIEESAVFGSSDSTDYAQIWRLSNGKLAIVQQIDSNTHFELNGQYTTFDRPANFLTTRSSHYLDLDAHCCISAYDELTFSWTGQDFRLHKKQTRLTRYGLDQGRKIPPP